MPSEADNEFLTSTQDNRVRPYTVGMKRHLETIATIVVFTQKDVTDTTNKINYLDETNLSNPIKSLISEANSQSVRDENRKNRIVNGMPSLPNGDVAHLSLDGENDFYGVFNNFSLLSVQEASEQIVKVQVNFGSSWNAFLFGEKPKIYHFSGFFIDTMDYPYYQEFMVAYDKFLSGRRAVEKGLQTTMVYDGRIVDGYILDISTTHTAGDQMIKRFNFTVLVKGSYWIRNNMVPSLAANNLGTGLAPLEPRYNVLTNEYRHKKVKLNTANVLAGNPYTSISDIPPERTDIGFA